MLVKAEDPEVEESDRTRSKRKRLRALCKSGIPVVKIIDFGLAKAFHTATDPKSLTHDGFVGTPAFASPEQIAHSKSTFAPTFTRSAKRSGSHLPGKRHLPVG